MPVVSASALDHGPGAVTFRRTDDEVLTMLPRETQGDIERYSFISAHWSPAFPLHRAEHSKSALVALFFWRLCILQTEDLFRGLPR